MYGCHTLLLMGLIRTPTLNADIVEQTCTVGASETNALRCITGVVFRWDRQRADSARRELVAVVADVSIRSGYGSGGVCRIVPMMGIQDDLFNTCNILMIDDDREGRPKLAELVLIDTLSAKVELIRVFVIANVKGKVVIGFVGKPDGAVR